MIIILHYILDEVVLVELGLGCSLSLRVSLMSSLGATRAQQLL